jgi:hypothetical protein
LKAFTSASDKEIWDDLWDVEAKAKIIRESPLFAALRGQASDQPWCCREIGKSSKWIVLRDGTSMRVHFCPRCGREL